MARRRRGLPVNGVVLLDKPKGISSNHALQRVRRLFEAQKAGHTGTLDPMATGLLPICLGEATKFSAHLLEADKMYRTRVELGVITDTGDAEGNVIERREVPSLTAEDVEAVLVRFRGEIDQVPPMYSALKHQGKKLYELAREGKQVERAARRVSVYDARLLAFDRGTQPDDVVGRVPRDDDVGGARGLLQGAVGLVHAVGAEIGDAQRVIPLGFEQRAVQLGLIAEAGLNVLARGGSFLVEAAQRHRVFQTADLRLAACQNRDCIVPAVLVDDLLIGAQLDDVGVGGVFDGVAEQVHDR